MDEFLNSQFIVNFQDIIVPAIFSTLRMLFFSMLFGMIIGMVVAILLVMTSPYGLNPKPKLYKFVSFWVNIYSGHVASYKSDSWHVGGRAGGDSAFDHSSFSGHRQIC